MKHGGTMGKKKKQCESKEDDDGGLHLSASNSF